MPRTPCDPSRRTWSALCMFTLRAAGPIYHTTRMALRATTKSAVHSFSICADRICTVYSFWGASAGAPKIFRDLAAPRSCPHEEGATRVARAWPSLRQWTRVLASRERHDFVDLRRMASVYILATPAIPVLQRSGKLATSQWACMQWVTVVRNPAGLPANDFKLLAYVQK